MKTLLLLFADVLLCIAPVDAAEQVSLREVAPTAAELGDGWESGEITCMIDPLCDPPEVVQKGHSDPERLLQTTRDMMEHTGRVGYLRIRYSHRFMTNHECVVYIQRWPSARALSEHRYRQDAIPGKAPPRIGDQAYWSGGPYVSALGFHLDQYMVVVQARASDESQILRVAEVIEAKLRGRPIPRDVTEPNHAVRPYIGRYRGGDGDSIVIQSGGGLWWVPADDPYFTNASYVGMVTRDSKKSKLGIASESPYVGTELSISEDGRGVTIEWSKPQGHSSTFERVQ